MKPGIFLVACLISLNIFSQTQKLPDSLNLFFSFPCLAFNGEFEFTRRYDKEYLEIRKFTQFCTCKKKAWQPITISIFQIF